MPRDLDWYIRNFERQKEQRDLETRRAEAREKLRQKIIQETGKDPRARQTPGRATVSGGEVISQLNEAYEKLEEAQQAVHNAQEMLKEAQGLVDAAREDTESETLAGVALHIVGASENADDTVLAMISSARDGIEEAIANMRR